MWIAAVEDSRKIKPENPSFMCGLRGGLGGLELRAGDFFPPDFPVPVAFHKADALAAKSGMSLVPTRDPRARAPGQIDNRVRTRLNRLIRKRLLQPDRYERISSAARKAYYSDLRK